MRKVREILRLKYEARLPHRAIAQACSVSPGTVSEYLTLARVAGLGWPLPDGLDDASLEKLLFPGPPGAGVERPLPEFAEMHQELKRKEVTLQLLWHEYYEVHPAGYRYSQYCELYRRWAAKLSPTMRQTHRAGEKLFVDYAGKRPCLTDPRTGELTPVELFVGVLGASSYTYAEATASQQLPCWVGAHERMLQYFGGSTEIWVPDNVRSAITRADRYEPEVNRTYSDMARHYGAAVIPARAGKPRDKAKVEAAVQVAERWIVAVLRKRTFFCLSEMNHAIRECLQRLNERRMRVFGVSRRELYEKLDRPALKQLPSQRFEPYEWKECGVNIDYHVEVDHNFYSVPYQLHGQRVEARFTSSTVEILFKNERVASHLRLRGRGQHSTKPEHMPRSHREYAAWTPSRLVAWAEKAGPATARVVDEVLRSRPHPEQGFRSGLGIIRLGQRLGADRLEAACLRAERLGSYRFQTVKNILQRGLDRIPLEEDAAQAELPFNHENIRGASYYAAKETEEC